MTHWKSQVIKVILIWQTKKKTKKVITNGKEKWQNGWKMLQLEGIIMSNWKIIMINHRKIGKWMQQTKKYRVSSWFWIVYVFYWKLDSLWEVFCFFFLIFSAELFILFPYRNVPLIKFLTPIGYRRYNLLFFILFLNHHRISNRPDAAYLRSYFKVLPL